MFGYLEDKKVWTTLPPDRRSSKHKGPAAGIRCVSVTERESMCFGRLGGSLGRRDSRKEGWRKEADEEFGFSLSTLGIPGKFCSREEVQLYVTVSMGSQWSTSLSIFNFEEESLTEPGDRGLARLPGQRACEASESACVCRPSSMWVVGEAQLRYSHCTMGTLLTEAPKVFKGCFRLACGGNTDEGMSGGGRWLLSCCPGWWGRGG